MSSRLRRVARTTQQAATRYGPSSPPATAASPSASATLRDDERAPCPMLPIVFQHPMRISVRCGSSRRAASEERLGSAGGGGGPDTQRPPPPPARRADP